MNDHQADDGLDDVMREFQGVDTPSVALVTAVERGRAKLVRGRVVGFVVGLLLWGYSIHTLLGHPNAADVFFSLTQMALPVVTILFANRSSKNTWLAKSETTRGFLELQLERRRDWIRRMRFMRRQLIPVLAGAILVHQALLLRAHPEIELLGLRGYVVPYVILAGLFWHCGWRRARFESEAEEIAGRIVSLESSESKMHL